MIAFIAVAILIKMDDFFHANCVMTEAIHGYYIGHNTHESEPIVALTKTKVLDFMISLLHNLTSKSLSNFEYRITI